MWRNRNPNTLLVGTSVAQLLWKTAGPFSKFKHRVTLWPNNSTPFLGIYARKMKTSTYTKIYAHTFTAALFIRAKECTQSKRPLAVAYPCHGKLFGNNKQRHTQRCNGVDEKENKTENVTLHARSQSQKPTYRCYDCVDMKCPEYANPWG